MPIEEKHEPAVLEAVQTLVETLGNGNLGLVIASCESHIISRRAYEDGKNAASWLVDGNTPDPGAVLVRLAKGIEDGDPEIMDELPEPRLSGEMADEPTWERVIEDELQRRPSDDGDGALFQEYGEHFQEGVIDKISEMVRAYATSED